MGHATPRPAPDELRRVGEVSVSHPRLLTAVLAGALLGAGIAILRSVSAVRFGAVMVACACLGAVLYVATVTLRELEGPRRSPSRWADEPPLEIEGLADADVRRWYGYAVAALERDGDYGAAEFEAALDHLIARRGPIGYDGRPDLGHFRPNGSGGFELADEIERERQKLLGALSAPIDCLGRPLILSDGMRVETINEARPAAGPVVLTPPGVDLWAS